MPAPLVRLDLREDFAVAPCRGEIGLQRLGIDAGEFEEPLVVRASVVILAARVGERGAAFVEHSQKQGVTADTLPRTAPRTLRKVRARRAVQRPI
jgi:hypothetical protein